MDAAELDTNIEELEIRLERLRALYEQYFLGIEKIEPSVARKDVDRRIHLLRREKIRNTAKRFKLQTIIQRYNTFQQYWQRICREIENGTYKRHVLRAERTYGPQDLMTIAARRRLGRSKSDAPEARSSAPPRRRPRLKARAHRRRHPPPRPLRPSARPRLRRVPRRALRPLRRRPLPPPRAHSRPSPQRRARSRRRHLERALPRRQPPAAAHRSLHLGVRRSRAPRTLHRLRARRRPRPPLRLRP